MIEALAQAATLLLLDAAGGRHGAGVQLRGVDGAKFRKHVIPGDQLKLVVTLGATRGPLVRATAIAEVDGQTVVEAELLLAVTADRAHRSAGARVADRGDRRRHGRRRVCGRSVRTSASAATARLARRR